MSDTKYSERYSQIKVQMRNHDGRGREMEVGTRARSLSRATASPEATLQVLAATGRVSMGTCRERALLDKLVTHSYATYCTRLERLLYMAEIRINVVIILSMPSIYFT